MTYPAEHQADVGSSEAGLAAPSWRRWAGAGLVVVALATAATFVRLAGQSQPLWLDELATAWVIRDGYQEIPTRARINNLSPVYYSIAAASARVLGYDAFGIRYPSLVAGVLLVPAVFLLGYRLSGSLAVALFAAALTAFDPILARYSVEARPYALVQLGAVFQAHVFLGLLAQGGRLRVAVYASLTALLFYLHYFSAWLVVVEVAFVGYLLFRKLLDRTALERLTIGLAVAGLLCLPALPHLGYLFHRKGTLGFASTGTLEDAFGRFSLARYLFFPLMVAVTVDLLCRPDASRPLSARPRIHSAAFLLLWFLIPSLGIWFVSKSGLMHIDLDRYAIVSSMVPLLLAGVAATFLRSVAAQFSLALLAFIFVSVNLTGGASRLEAVNRLKSNRSDWRSAVHFLNERVQTSDRVYVYSSLVEAAWLTNSDDPTLHDYVLCPVNSVYQVAAPAERIAPLFVKADASWNVESADALAELDAGHDIWLAAAVEESFWPKLNDLLARLRAKKPGMTIEGQQFKGVYVARLIGRSQAGRP